MMEQERSCLHCQHIAEGKTYTHWRTGKPCRIYTCRQQRRAITMMYGGRQAATCRSYQERIEQQGARK